MDKLAAGGILHVGNTQRQLLHQGAVLRVTREFIVFDEGQQADSIGAQLDFIANIHIESQYTAIFLRIAFDQGVGQISQGALDACQQRRTLRELPAFQHGIHGAGVTQCVVVGNGASEAGEMTIGETAILMYLARQKICAAVDQGMDLIGLQTGNLSAAGIEVLRRPPVCLQIGIAR